MKKYIILFILFLFFGIHVAYANDDLGLDAYTRDINTPANASAINIYDAWVDNMTYRIEHGVSEGIIIDAEKETDKYITDGVGNIILKDGINVGPIINKTDLSNTIVIIKSNQRKRF